MKFRPVHLLAFSSLIFTLGASSPKNELERLTDEITSDSTARQAISISKESAQQAADMHLALRNARWGMPVDVREDDDKYYFFFTTPENERMFLGMRSVAVDKLTRVAKIRDRK